MKAIKTGYLYELNHFESPGVERLQFIHKESTSDISPGTAQLVTTTDGTTNEEVLRVLIDRLTYLQSQIPCRENAIVITKLEESLMWLEKRTADRVKRGVEGKPLS